MKHFCKQAYWTCEADEGDLWLKGVYTTLNTAVKFCPFCGFTLEKHAEDTAEAPDRSVKAANARLANNSRLDEIEEQLLALSILRDCDTGELRDDLQSLQDRLEQVERLFDWEHLPGCDISPQFE